MRFGFLLLFFLTPKPEVELVIPPKCVQSVKCLDDWIVRGGKGYCQHLEIKFACYRSRKVEDAPAQQ